MNTYKFDCGCEFPIINDTIKEIDGLPSIRIDYDNINYSCPAVWSLFSKGQTKGIFQLETNLGQSWAKKVQPVSIEELAAITAILRPSCLKGMIEGKSIAQRYADRNTGNETAEPFHPAVAPLLESTHQLMLYQENTMAIAQLLAGFDLKQGVGLIKGIGKKKADIIAGYQQQFIDGCEKTGIVNKEDAEMIFDVISKAARYQFNASHGFSYGVTAYICAVVKQHFPLHFFTAWLNFANQKIKPKIEIADLIQEAKQFNISVENPNISYKNELFLIEQGKIRYGLGSIKSVGAENLKKVLEVVAESEKRLCKPIKEFTWHETLLFLLTGIRKDVVNNLIHAGALSQYGMSRQHMLFEYNKLSDLKTHLDWLRQTNCTNSVVEDIQHVLNDKPKLTAKQKEKLANVLISVQNPASNMEDAIEVVAACEEDVLGISLSCSKLDAKNLGYVNCTCKEFLSGEHINNVIVAMQLSRVTEWSPKDSDSKLCFLTGHDKTGKIDVMVPSKEYEKYNFLLFEGNTIAVHGSKNNRDNLKAKVITQL